MASRRRERWTVSILSIQSWVAYGHVGNGAAVFPLQRLGFEVWAVHTVQFSNHTGYGAWRGTILEAAAVAEILLGIAERGVLGECEAVLSGYVGEAALGEAILDAVRRVKAVNPQALYCCDPVIGDIGRGVFVRPGIPEFMAEEALPAADIVTPNHFELELLAGRKVASLEDALGAADALRLRGPKIVLVTSLGRADAAAGTIEMLALGDAGAFLVAMPMLQVAANGAGDAVAALFLGHFLKTRSLEAALGNAASSVWAVLEATHRAGSPELALVAAQDELVRPPRRFPVTRVR
jgi:pyridoxine kinase